MGYRLSDIDLRHLQVFKAVVECRGFTSAQAILNVGQSTISSQMSQLEARLGIRLCERGRTGFELTAKGKRVYEETLKIFRAHQDFQNITSELKGSLSGYLSIAVIDNVVSDPGCPIVRAFELFEERGHDVSINLDIMRPDEIERSLLDKDTDVAIGTFHHQVPELDYRKIYVEVNELFCGPSHPIFKMNDETEIRAAVQTARKVTRSYLDKGDLFPLGDTSSTSSGLVQNLEAAAILVLGGGHIGFLPTHYASHWVAGRQMKPILPEEFVYRSDFSIVTRRTPRKSLILNTFLADLDRAAAEKEQIQADGPRPFLSKCSVKHSSSDA